jgi:hypothetical protein
MVILHVLSMEDTSTNKETKKDAYVTSLSKHTFKDERTNECTHALDERANQFFLELVVKIAFLQEFVDYLF